MAVPTSGTLSMLNIAQEALYGTWGSGTITGPISIYDMINGGNSNGSGNSYPTVNDGCTPNPVDWTGASQTYSYWIFSQGTFFGCTSADCPSISVSSSGVVTTNGCQCP